MRDELLIKKIEKKEVKNWERESYGDYITFSTKLDKDFNVKLGVHYSGPFCSSVSQDYFLEVYKKYTKILKFVGGEIPKVYSNLDKKYFEFLKLKNEEFEKDRQLFIKQLKDLLI